MRAGVERALNPPPPPLEVRPTRERIYGELRELEFLRPDRDERLPWDDR